jgi:hypothetical protein
LYVSGLLPGTTEPDLGHYFAKYGPVDRVELLNNKTPPIAFVHFLNPCDADCAAVDNHPDLRVSVKNIVPPDPMPYYEELKNPWVRPEGADPLKVFVAGLGFDDPEEEIGDFFSQWGLVTMVKKVKDKEGKDRGFGFVHFACESAVARILQEPGKPQFKRKYLDIKWRIVCAPGEAISDTQLDDLRVRSIHRHFAKISNMGKPQAPPPMMPPHHGGMMPPPHGGMMPPVPGAHPPPPGPPGAPQPGGLDPYAAAMDREIQERAAEVRAAYERLQYERALLERERLAMSIERERGGAAALDRDPYRRDTDARDAYERYLAGRGGGAGGDDRRDPRDAYSASAQ